MTFKISKDDMIGGIKLPLYEATEYVHVGKEKAPKLRMLLGRQVVQK